ncbi:MAG: hypothetical protein MRERV_62c005 [Mycoplasmataceae bacterium RV_VA103A]|nr:MAG: hypothetical protein MRERV_62c005 [Mycoplasmataceae bacterium RV_VA103A]
MSRNFWFALVFFLFLVIVALWKLWAWLLWKLLRLRKKEQVFSLLSKHRFIEITGASGKGKSWLLSHLFKHLQGVKFTNFPTPQSTYTLSKETLEVHISGKWGAPHKFYYFLDDLKAFEKWAGKEFREHGYSALQDYISQAGKLGGTFIWTTNSPTTNSVFQTNKNKTWKVLTYISFMDKSLLFVQANDSWYNLLPTIIPIDNQEITSFYDPHWNIPKDYQENWLRYIFEEKLKAEEAGEILRVISESGQATSEEEWLKNMKFNRNLLLQYLQERKKEEKVVRKKSQRIKDIKSNLKKYQLKTEKLTPQDIEKFDKEEKRKKKSKPTKITEEIDLDQEKQEPEEEKIKLSKFSKRKRNK